MPSIAGILRHHLGGDLVGEDLMPLASIGTGATGADIAGWARGARMAARAAGREMVLADLVDQVAPPETRSPAVLKAVATHEASHCLGAELLSVGAVQTVSIVSRGGYAGRTDAKLRNFESLTADEIDAYVVSVLCGRAADERWGAASSGSAGGPRSDLAIATATVAAKHGTYGLGGSILYRGGNTEAVQLIDKDRDFRALVEADLHRLYEVAQAFVAEHASGSSVSPAGWSRSRCWAGPRSARSSALPPPTREMKAPSRPWEARMAETDLDAGIAKVVLDLLSVRRGLDPDSFETLLGAVLAEIELGKDVAEEKALEAAFRRSPAGNVIPFPANGLPPREQ